MTVIPQNYEEREKASRSYLVSMVAIMAGLPLPIFNLLATFIFFMANRKGAYFVRWHATQALLSQVMLLLINAPLLWWTLHIVFSSESGFTNEYFAYLILVLLINLIEFIATIATAIATQKGKHYAWWVLGDLTDEIQSK